MHSWIDNVTNVLHAHPVCGTNCVSNDNLSPFNSWSSTVTSVASMLSVFHFSVNVIPTNTQRATWMADWLIELWFYVPLNTFSETFPQADLLAWYGKKLNLKQRKHAFTNQEKCTTTQKTKARFSRLLRHPAWKQSRSLFSNEKISKGGDKYRKSEEKRISGEMYDINKQIIYIGLKSKIESGRIMTRSPHRAQHGWYICR